MSWAREEQETILRFDYLDQTWYAWTNVQPHLTKFQKQGWELSHPAYEEGRLVAGDFKAPKQFVTIGNVRRKKRSGSIVGQKEAIGNDDDPDVV